MKFKLPVDKDGLEDIESFIEAAPVAGNQFPTQSSLNRKLGQCLAMLDSSGDEINKCWVARNMTDTTAFFKLWQLPHVLQIS